MMKALIVYDSVFGNTEQIAQAMGKGLGAPDQVQVLKVDAVQPQQLMGLELLIVGSPTRAFRPTPAITKLLKAIPANGLSGARVAAFDTRIPADHPETPGLLRFMVKLFGYAAKPIADKLQSKGGKLALPPEGFFVQGTEGPLQDGELERASEWARQLLVES